MQVTKLYCDAPRCGETTDDNNYRNGWTTMHISLWTPNGGAARLDFCPKHWAAIQDAPGLLLETIQRVLKIKAP